MIHCEDWYGVTRTWTGTHTWCGRCGRLLARPSCPECGRVFNGNPHVMPASVYRRVRRGRLLRKSLPLIPVLALALLLHLAYGLYKKRTGRGIDWATLDWYPVVCVALWILCVAFPAYWYPQWRKDDRWERDYWFRYRRGTERSYESKPFFSFVATRYGRAFSCWLILVIAVALISKLPWRILQALH